MPVIANGYYVEFCKLSPSRATAIFRRDKMF